MKRGNRVKKQMSLQADQIRPCHAGNKFHRNFRNFYLRCGFGEIFNSEQVYFVQELENLTILDQKCIVSKLCIFTGHWVVYYQFALIY